MPQFSILLSEEGDRMINSIDMVALSDLTANNAPKPVL